ADARCDEKPAFEIGDFHPATCRLGFAAMWQGKILTITLALAWVAVAAWAQEPAPPPAPEPAPEAEPQPPAPKKPIVIDLDLTKQKALLLFDGRVMYESPISSGRAGHSTPTGDFAVLEKDIDHKSSLYGQIVNSHGETVVAGADSFMPVPKGCK